MGTTPNKTNYKKKYENNLHCSLCLDQQSEESLEHLLNCTFLKGKPYLVQHLESIKVNDIYGDLDSQIKAVKVWAKIFRIYENMNKKWNELESASNMRKDTTEATRRTSHLGASYICGFIYMIMDDNIYIWSVNIMTGNCLFDPFLLKYIHIYTYFVKKRDYYKIFRLSMKILSEPGSQVPCHYPTLYPSVTITVIPGQQPTGPKYTTLLFFLKYHGLTERKRKTFWRPHGRTRKKATHLS